MIVVKVGGSLYGLPDLRTRLLRWLLTLDDSIVLVPGGGQLVEEIRRLDQVHRLGEESCHWLALRALSLNAHFLAGLLDNASVVDGLSACAGLWNAGKLPVLDLLSFAEEDEGRSGTLPHCWEVTSDSFAARVAIVYGARGLYLLKSVDVPFPYDWRKAVIQGLVDEHFADVLGTDESRLRVSAVNLLHW